MKSLKCEANVLAGAATVHLRGEFLLLRRSRRESFLPDVWGIPAGQVRPGEDPQDACARELAEETGLRGAVGELIGYSTFQSRRGGVRLSNFQFNFLVVVNDRTVRIDEANHSEYRWIPLDDFDNPLVDSFTRRVMVAARRNYRELDRPGAPHLITDR